MTNSDHGSAGIRGKAALVTGGGSGIGLGCAARFAAEGAHVTICGRSEERLAAAVAEIEAGAAEGVTVTSISTDVTDEAQVAAAVAKACEPTGGLDIVLTSAGGSLTAGPVHSIDVDLWRQTVDLNLTGTFLTLKHVGPVMVRGGGGSFIAVSSIAGSLTHRWFGAYGPSKAGIEQLVAMAADELGPSNVRVNAIAPGIIDTELMDAVTSGSPVLDDYLSQMPISRVGTVEDCAGAAMFFAGPDSTWVTGQTLQVDGGHSLRRGPDFSSFFEPLFGAEGLRGVVADEG
ncbi:MAG: SDR family oxidoreductase [Acidimicrobiales bacterium]|nr:SDR family oxidoreductase [Acidimicrobiales bacterium]